MSFFLDRGHRVHLILASDRPLTVDVDKRLTLHQLPKQSRSPLRFTSVLRTRRRLQDILRASSADILHAHYLTGYGWLTRLSGFRPYVVTVWGSDIFMTPRVSRVARIWAWVALRGADLVTADSSDLARSAIALGASATRTRLIQFGVDTASFRPGRDATEIRAELRAQDRRVVFAPRAIAPLYRTITLVRALSSLPEDCLLVLTEYNHEPSYLTAVQAEIARLRLEDRVRFVDKLEHEQMPDAYALADVVVSVPETDATSVSVLEAMACGRPIIATDLPSAREWLGEVAPWALVPVGDAEHTSAAISRALDLGSRTRGDLADAFREIVLSRADFKTNMLQVEEAYRSLAGP